MYKIGVIKNGTIFLGGEITSNLAPDYDALVSLAIAKAGYIEELCPEFNSKKFELRTILDAQSPDIAMGVDCHDEDKGAGDIGIMFGGAINEAPDLTGHSHYLAKVLSKDLHDRVLSRELYWGRPDIKTQVSIGYENKVAKSIETVVICISHAEDKDLEEIRKEMTEFVKEKLTAYNEMLLNVGSLPLDTSRVEVLVNPTGRFAIFGPASDAGEVGRKLVVS